MATVLTLEEVATYLRVHPSTIYRLLKKKELPGFKIGSDWRFNLESIDRWRADLETSRHAGSFSDRERPHGSKAYPDERFNP